jgi:hypothetical protein
VKAFDAMDAKWSGPGVGGRSIGANAAATSLLGAPAMSSGSVADSASSASCRSSLRSGMKAAPASDTA